MIKFQERLDHEGVLTDEERDVLLRCRAKLREHTDVNVQGAIVLHKGQVGLARKVSSELKNQLGKDGRTAFLTWVYGTCVESSKQLNDRQLFDLLAVSGLHKDETITEGNKWVHKPWFYKWVGYVNKVTGGQTDMLDVIKEEDGLSVNDKMAKTKKELGYY